LVKRPDLAIKNAKTFLNFIDQYKVINAQYKAAQEALSAIKAFMELNSITEIDIAGDRGKLKLEKGSNIWTYTEDIDPDYLKTVLDTPKLNGLLKDGFQPPHTAVTETHKLMPRLK